MKSAKKNPGVTVCVEDLINVRGQLTGLSLKHMRHRTARSSGAQQTRVRGRGMEYEESRSYVAGDDVRTMDWRVMARTGELHSKIFTQEKERSIVLLTDLSASMFYGTRYGFKSYAAAQLAAHIGWLVVQSGDRLGALIASGSGHHEIRPKKGSGNLMRLFHHISQECNVSLPIQDDKNCLNFMLAELRRVIKPGSIIVLISDMLGIDEQTPSLISSLVKHNDLMTFWVHDQTEVNEWPSGRFQLMTQGNQGSLDLMATPAVKWLQVQQNNHRSAIEQLTGQFKSWLCPISCNQQVTVQLAKFLRA